MQENARDVMERPYPEKFQAVSSLLESLLIALRQPQLTSSSSSRRIDVAERVASFGT
jgi:hypothetical protein